MRKPFLFILLLTGSVTVSSACSARGGGSYLHVPAVSNYRAVRFVYPASVYRAMTRAYVPRHQPRYAAQPRIAPVKTVQRTAFEPRNPFYNPVRYAPERFVRIRGGTIGLPALAAVSAPIILDMPQLGEIIVPQETYVIAYPLLISESEADREKAFTMLKEQTERNPDSRVAVASPQASAENPCPDCKDTIEILHTCRPVGECDLAERLVNSPKNPAYLVPERTADQTGSIH
jgi:hypothetical protein